MIHCSQPLSNCAFPGDDSGLGGRVVRFDSECELIPLDSLQKQRPTLTTKSYSLPLWKKQSSFMVSSKSVAVGELSAVQSGSVEVGSSKEKEKHLVLKVPIPRFKSSSKTIRCTPLHGEIRPLSSCLVQRDARLPGSLPPRIQARRTSLPTYLSQSAPTIKRFTVPLRSCCKACYSVIEQSSLQGESWQIKFSLPTSQRRGTNGDGSDRFNDVVMVDEVEALHQVKECFNVTTNVTGCSSFASTGHVDVPCATNSSPSPMSSPVIKTPTEDDDDDQLFPLPSCPKIRTSSPRVFPRSSPSASPLSTGVPQFTMCDDHAGISPPSPCLLDQTFPLQRTTSVSPSLS